MTPGDALRSAVQALAHRGWTPPGRRTHAELLEAAAGPGPSGGGRGGVVSRALTELGYPPVSKTEQPDRYRERAALQRRLQRLYKGETAKLDPALARQLRRSADRHRRRLKAGRVADQLRAMRRHGVTVHFLDAEVRISSDERWRTFTSQHVGGDKLEGAIAAMERSAWDDAAVRFADAWGVAYGIGGGVQWLEVDTLDLLAPP